MEKLQTMRTQFLAMMIGASLVTMLCIGALFVIEMMAETEEKIVEVRETLTRDVEREIKIQTETAISLIDEIYKRQQAGLLTEAQAKKEAADFVRDLRYDDGKGYFWIDTYEGVNVVLLGRKGTEGKSRINLTDPTGKQFIKEMLENGRKPGGGYTDLMFAKPNETEPLPKRNYTLSFAPYQWVVGTGVWIDYIDDRVSEMQEKADAAFNKSLMTMFGIIVVLQVLIIIFAVFFANRVVTPIRRVTEILDVLSTGDFRKTDKTRNLDVDRPDEIGIMARAVQKLQENVQEMVKKVVNSAEQVAAASEQLTASADQSTIAINQVADSIVNVAGACNEQFTEVENASSQAERLKVHMDNFTDTLSASSSRIEEATIAADQGGKSVENAVDQMKKIETSVSTSAGVIALLGEESEKIGKIVDAISNIAEQTNLLALNAAIEAARAGEHGRGFAVVADEVRKLAEQSQVSAREISDLIGSIQAKAQDAVVAMQDGVANVKHGTDAVDGAGKTFQEIMHTVSEVQKASNKMEEIVANLVNSTDVITGSVENINTKSREVARESETVSAASEEQTATMHEIADASRSLAEMAQQMQEVIGRFKV
ncbi:MAG: methyl-accepting chemotaxis protein [Selenomonadaceae bacterium]|nr:methyl-accepting chemotaxis protein [Selenomonadaceae bacterium]